MKSVDGICLPLETLGEMIPREKHEEEPPPARCVLDPVIAEVK